MRIAYPWKFTSNNYHIRIKTNKKYDLDGILGIKIPDLIDCKTDEILLTFSDVISTINEKDKIIYHENIIKCKVIFEGKEYYYPIITFVDDVYSLIRGFYLGFEKEFAKLKMTNHRIEVESERISYAIGINKTESDDSKKQFITYPFLLYQDWRFDEENVKQEFVTLKTNRYNVSKIATFDVNENDFEKLLEIFRINKNHVQGIEKFYIEDEFVLEGTEICSCGR